jgi:hypothetical protein
MSIMNDAVTAAQRLIDSFGYQQSALFNLLVGD